MIIIIIIKKHARNICANPESVNHVCNNTDPLLIESETSAIVAIDKLFSLMSESY